MLGIPVPVDCHPFWLTTNCDGSVPVSTPRLRSTARSVHVRSDKAFRLVQSAGDTSGDDIPGRRNAHPLSRQETVRTVALFVPAHS